MFDLKKFQAANLEQRTKEIKVPELKDFFEKGAKKVWIVRGLDGPELFRVQEAGKKVEALQEVIKALAKGESMGVVKEALGLDEKKAPEDLVKRTEALFLGSVEPKIKRDHARKLFKAFPVVAMALSEEIYKLTGLGAELGESKAS